MNLLAAVAALVVLVAMPGRLDAEPRLEGMPPGSYSIDPKHTHMYFSYDHVGFSQAHGRFDHVRGRIEFVPAAPEQSRLSVEIDPASIDTNVAELDTLLKSAKFFDVAAFPRITFSSLSIRRLASARGRVTGALSLHGLTKPVVLEVTLNKFLKDEDPKFSRFGFSARTHLNRKEWGLGAVPLVANDVLVTIDAEFTKDMP